MIRTSVITGASRGIGKAIAMEFARRNDNLAIISRHYEEAERAVKEIQEIYPRLIFAYECDVSNKEQVIETFGKIKYTMGKIDVLVNNAGVNSRKTMKSGLDERVAGFEEEFRTNLLGSYLCSCVAADYMDNGSIINISSIKGKEATTSPGYGASKAGVIKLTKDLAKALAPKIRVNCIIPGFIDTGMTTELSEDKKQAYMKLIPAGRFGTVDEVAALAGFLASKEASYITGADIHVDGGYYMD